MKKYLIVILVLVCFMSCNLRDFSREYANLGLWDNYHNRHFYESFNDIAIITTFEEITAKQDIITFINKNIKYIKDLEDNVSSPYNTLKNGYGDCEDFALLYLNILYVVFGIKGDLVLVDDNNRTIDNGGYVNHALVRYDNNLVCPQTGDIQDYKVSYWLSFNDIFNVN